MKLIAGLVFVTLFTLSNAFVAMGIGDCPDGHQVGDVWYTPDCVEYECFNGTYSLTGCGVYAFEYDKTICYVEVNSSAPYPTCCDPMLICKGDPGFNESKLEPPEVTTKSPETAPPTTRKAIPKHSPKPTTKPTPKPTTKPTPKPTTKPTKKPTPKPTKKPTPKPQRNRH